MTRDKIMRGHPNILVPYGRATATATGFDARRLTQSLGRGSTALGATSPRRPEVQECLAAELRPPTGPLFEGTTRTQRPGRHEPVACEPRPPRARVSSAGWEEPLQALPRRAQRKRSDRQRHRAESVNEGQERSHRASREARRSRVLNSESGYTLLELLIIVAIIGLICSIAMGYYAEILRKVKLERAVLDLRGLENAITLYSVDHGFPQALTDLDIIPPIDPWGNPYQYLPIEGASRGMVRKDRFLVPLNSDYDLYSMGPDGESRPPLTAKASRDDIIRAGNGAYVGPADEY